MSLKAGQYVGKIVTYGIKTTKGGDPAPTVKFAVQTPEGGFHEVFWQGSFKSEVSTDIALKALLACGLENGDDIENLANGPDSGLLDMDAELSLKIELEADQNDRTKIYPRVRGVSRLGSSEIQNSITATEAKVLTRGLNLSAAFEKIKAKAPKVALQDLPPAGY